MRLHRECCDGTQSQCVAVRRRCERICNGASARVLRSVHHKDRLALEGASLLCQLCGPVSHNGKGHRARLLKVLTYDKPLPIGRDVV